MLAGIKVNLLGADVLPASDKNSTTDYFQYIILLRNSEALTPFE